MAALVAPVAGRLRKPSWKDARLVVGILLVLLATALGAAAMRAADDRVPVFAARQVLLPGQRLDPSMLTQVAVQVDRTGDTYFPARETLPETGFVLREVRAGELLPRSAVGSAAQVSVQPLAVGVDQVSAATLVAGSVVDVYADTPAPAAGAASAGGTTTAYAGPRRVLDRVSVARVAAPGAGLGSTSRAFVQLLIPSGRIAELIALLDAGAKVTVVAVPGSLLAGS